MLPTSGRGRSAAAVEQQVVDRHPDDPQVGHQRFVAHVVQVVLELDVGVLFGCGVPVPDLRPTGEPGPHEMAGGVERQLLLELAGVVDLLGAGPTTDSSPRKMLITWGNSSRCVRRSSLPKPVIRGSSFDVQPEMSTAPGAIVRNFKISNGRR